MPYYLFQHSDTNEIHEIWFHMNDDKVYHGEHGDQKDKWKRIWTIPNAAISSRIADPFNPKDFKAATDNKKGQTVGQLWERSAEESDRRAQKYGKDPIKEAYFDNYKKRTGLKNQYQAREEAGVKAKEFVQSLGLRS